MAGCILVMAALLGMEDGLGSGVMWVDILGIMVCGCELYCGVGIVVGDGQLWEGVV